MCAMGSSEPAAPWQVSQWLNTPRPLTPDDFRGRVVVMHAFQMLCPACVSHGIPQALRVHQLFAQELVAVIGLHTVFEHHEAMGPQALRAFMHEYRIPFPVGIDQAQERSPVPRTMQAYDLHGTPSVVVLDRQGRVRLNHFGQIDDLHLGAVIFKRRCEPDGLSEGEVFRPDDIGASSRRLLPCPIHVGVRNDQCRRRCAPEGLVVGRVGVADQGHVVAPDKCAVDGRADARIRLRSGDDDAADVQPGQHGLELRSLEGVAEGFLDHQLVVHLAEFGDDLPVVAALHQVFVHVLDPHHRNLAAPGGRQQAGDVGHDGVSLVRVPDNGDLHVHDEQGCVPAAAGHGHGHSVSGCIR